MRDRSRILRILTLIALNLRAETACCRKNMRENRVMLDETDLRLLSALQKDAHLTAQELGEQLNLSASQAGRRRQRLEADGYIRGYTARLDPLKLGLNVQGFVQVHLEHPRARIFAQLCTAFGHATGDCKRVDNDRGCGLSVACLL